METEASQKEIPAAPIEDDASQEEVPAEPNEDDASQEEVPAEPNEDDASQEEVPAEPNESDAPQEENSVAPIEDDASDAPAVEASDSDEEPTPGPKKLRAFLKTFGITLSALLATLLIGYLAGCLLFTVCFYPNTKMGPLDLSWMSRSRAVATLEAAATHYQVKAEGKGLSVDLSGKDIGLTVDAEKTLRGARADIEVWTWPVRIFETHKVTNALVVAYDEGRVSKVVQDRVRVFNATATQPTNATIFFNNTVRTFQIKSEQVGTAFDQSSVEHTIRTAIIALKSFTEITDQDLLQPAVTAKDKRLDAARSAANTMIRTNLTLKMKDSVVATLGPAEIAPWVKLGSDLKVSFDDTAFAAWIEAVVAGCNTVGTERTYTRPDGKVVTVSGGSYGWKIDSDAFRESIRKSVAAGQTGVFEMPVIQEGSGFEGIGKRDWGKRYCDVDLTEQYARFYDDTGACVWESPIVSGRPSLKTPTGVFKINRWMSSPATLVGDPLPGQTEPAYRTKVSYWMPFVGGSVGLHDAVWQSSFGGNRWRTGYGSHGCVNLPLSKARDLYALIKVGDPVVSHY
ncbi:MAG: L,D-transpeptidase family protein [Actinomycetia bacterium]|nr:L,D-transpeptidase family protein [Actinomycetes bacterium]